MGFPLRPQVIYYVAVVGRDLNFNHELLLLPLLVGLRLEIAIMSNGDKVQETPRGAPHIPIPIPIPVSSSMGACLQFVNATAATGLICTRLPLNYVLSASVGHRVTRTPMPRCAYSTYGAYTYPQRCCGHFDGWARSANEQQLIKPWTLLTATIFRPKSVGFERIETSGGGHRPQAGDLSVSS